MKKKQKAVGPIEDLGLTLREAILKAGRFGAIRNEKFVRVDFDQNGKPTHLYDGRWVRPQNRSFSDEAVVAMGWESVENAAEIPVSYTLNFKSNWALAE